MKKKKPSHLQNLKVRITMNNFDKAIDEWLTREYMGMMECVFGMEEDTELEEEED